MLDKSLDSFMAITTWSNFGTNDLKIFATINLDVNTSPYILIWFTSLITLMKKSSTLSLSSIWINSYVLLWVCNLTSFTFSVSPKDLSIMSHASFDGSTSQTFSKLSRYALMDYKERFIIFLLQMFMCNLLFIWGIVVN